MKERKGDGAGLSPRVNLSKPVTSEDMKVFVGMLLLLGLTKRSSHDLNWSADPYLEIEGFRRSCQGTDFRASSLFSTS